MKGAREERDEDGWMDGWMEEEVQEQTEHGLTEDVDKAARKKEWMRRWREERQIGWRRKRGTESTSDMRDAAWQSDVA